MTTDQMRKLADTLDDNWIYAQDRHGWANDLRAHANRMDLDHPNAARKALEG